MTDPKHEMPVRKMEFGFTDDVDLVFFRGDPVLSYGSHAYWMTMPYLEPYLMRSIRAALPEVRDPVLQEQMRRFCSQEGQHYQQHAKVNEILRRRNPAFEALRVIEAELEADYKRFSAEKDHAFNLAYAEAFECMTMAMSRTQMDMRIHEQMTAPIRDLFLWHITEEMEHRRVAFDAYGAVGKGYLYRVRTGLWAQRHYLGYVQRLHACFLEADAARVREMTTPEMREQRMTFQQEFNRRNTPRMINTFMPWYNPARVRMPDEYEETRRHYSALAVSIS
jgi:predicted metal-dependent hydrolase